MLVFAFYFCFCVLQGTVYPHGIMTWTNQSRSSINTRERQGLEGLEEEKGRKRKNKRIVLKERREKK